MSIKKYYKTGAELNEENERARQAFFSDPGVQRDPNALFSSIIYNPNEVRTIIDMTEATMEEQEEFMKNRRVEDWDANKNR